MLFVVFCRARGRPLWVHVGCSTCLVSPAWASPARVSGRRSPSDPQHSRRTCLPLPFFRRSQVWVAECMYDIRQVVLCLRGSLSRAPGPSVLQCATLFRPWVGMHTSIARTLALLWPCDECTGHVADIGREAFSSIASLIATRRPCGSLVHSLVVPPSMSFIWYPRMMANLRSGVATCARRSNVDPSQRVVAVRRCNHMLERTQGGSSRQRKHHTHSHSAVGLRGQVAVQPAARFAVPGGAQRAEAIGVAHPSSLVALASAIRPSVCRRELQESALLCALVGRGSVAGMQAAQATHKHRSNRDALEQLRTAHLHFEPVYTHIIVGSLLCGKRRRDRQGAMAAPQESRCGAELCIMLSGRRRSKGGAVGP